MVVDVDADVEAVVVGDSWASVTRGAMMTAESKTGVEPCRGMIEHDEWAASVAGGPDDSDGGTGGV